MPPSDPQVPPLIAEYLFKLWNQCSGSVLPLTMFSLLDQLNPLLFAFPSLRCSLIGVQSKMQWLRFLFRRVYGGSESGTAILK